MYHISGGGGPIPKRMSLSAPESTTYVLCQQVINGGSGRFGSGNDLLMALVPCGIDLRASERKPGMRTSRSSEAT